MFSKLPFFANNNHSMIISYVPSDHHSDFLSGLTYALGSCARSAQSFLSCRHHLCYTFAVSSLIPCEHEHIVWSVNTCTHALCMRMALARAPTHKHDSSSIFAIAPIACSSCHHSSRSSSRVVERPLRPPPSEWTVTDEMAHSLLPCFSSPCSPAVSSAFAAGSIARPSSPCYVCAASRRL